MGAPHSSKENPRHFLVFWRFLALPWRQSQPTNGVTLHGFETEAASLTAPSLTAVAVDWTVNTDMLGEDGPSTPLPLDAAAGWWLVAVGTKGFRE